MAEFDSSIDAIRDFVRINSTGCAEESLDSPEIVLEMMGMSDYDIFYVNQEIYDEVDLVNTFSLHGLENVRDLFSRQEIAAFAGACPGAPPEYCMRAEAEEGEEPAPLMRLSDRLKMIKAARLAKSLGRARPEFVPVAPASTTRTRFWKAKTQEWAGVMAMRNIGKAMKKIAPLAITSGDENGLMRMFTSMLAIKDGPAAPPAALPAALPAAGAPDARAKKPGRVQTATI